MRQIFYQHFVGGTFRVDKNAVAIKYHQVRTHAGLLQFAMTHKEQL